MSWLNFIKEKMKITNLTLPNCAQESLGLELDSEKIDQIKVEKNYMNGKLVYKK